MKQNLIPLGLDFETFYSREYTLRQMTTAEYILDSQFEPIGMSLGVRAILPVWFSGTFDYLKSVLAQIPWDRTLVIAHNAMFDGAILEWIFGFKPAMYFCTMMGSRPYVAPYTGRSDLGTVAKYLQIGEKGDAVASAIGKHRLDFSAAELADYGRYCCQDVNLSTQIAQWIFNKMPEEEQILVDLTVKKFTRPQLSLDPAVLTDRLSEIGQEKHTLIEKLQTQKIDVTQLRSRPKFAALLKGYNVEVPTKISVRTGSETFAFSKLDAPFLELLEHEDSRVRELVEARLFLASNMEEARLERLEEIALLNFQGQCMLPVPLLYYGAHPGRFSGLDKINLQNLPRVKYMKDANGKDVVDPKSGSLRRAIVAPPGYVIVAGDLSNIEARIVATLAEAWDLVRAFAKGEDVYSSFASRIYGRAIDKKNNPDERFVGKTACLGLNYGMGPKKFATQMALAGRGMPFNEAQRIVYLYRSTYEHIPQYWQVLENALSNTRDPHCMQIVGPFCFMHERILLPNGMPIIYPGLKETHEGLAFRDRRSDEGWIRIWGGATLENVTQALARIILTRAELRLARLGLLAALQVHDELVYCVKEQYAEAVMKALTLATTAPVDFLPGLPIAVEVHAGKSYIECK